MENYINNGENTFAGSNTKLSIAKVFLYVFIGLVITAAVAFGVGAGFAYGLGTSAEVRQTYTTIQVIAAIALLVDTIVMSCVTLKGKHTILVPAIIYACLIGVFVSSFVIYIDWRILGMAFGLTALMFFLMSLIAFFTKGNLSPLVILAGGLVVGLGIISLFNLIFILCTGVANSAMYWVVSLGMFAVIMLISIFDLWNMKKIAEAGAMTNDIALYCAFSIYVDFIYIFIKLVLILASLSRN